MSKLPFHEWAPVEIARLRQRINALEVALALYNGEEPPPMEDAARLTAPAASTADKRRGPRISKYEPLFKAFESEGHPLSMDDMFAIAGRLGISIDRNNLRSQVFAQKGIGRTRSDGQNYVWGAEAPKETAPAEEASAVQE